MKKEREGRARDRRKPPESKKLAGGSGGTPRKKSSSPVAFELGFVGEKAERVAGYKKAQSW